MSTITHMHGVSYVSSKDAARSVGYTSDYIARLAREGKILSRRDGIQWFVELGSLKLFLQAVENARQERKVQLREERRKERERHVTARPETAPRGVTLTREHGVDDVVDVCVLPEEIASDALGTSATRAHALTAASLTLGVFVAVLVVFSGPLTPIAERSSASLIDSFVAATRFAWSFAFPWNHEIVFAPELESKNELDATGIVALPPGSADAQTIERVRGSFSDDVVVRLDTDRTTGTIVPVFNDGLGEEYQFVIVPLTGSP